MVTDLDLVIVDKIKQVTNPQSISAESTWDYHTEKMFTFAVINWTFRVDVILKFREHVFVNNNSKETLLPCKLRNQYKQRAGTNQEMTIC